ncbi:unnamed protein product [Cochlearia groenlandica]
METKPETTHRLPAGREDWWSEEATATLIEAWGDRYVSLNRGNLRQNDWRDVADAVNSSHGNNNKSRRYKTDVQCKNRIDTLKKKYKSEKSKSSSRWGFFDRLDFLIGHVVKKSPGSGAFKSPLMNHTGSKSPGSSLDDDDDDDDDDNDDYGFVVRKHRRVEDLDLDLSDESSCRELAAAIMKLGEVYERIESTKQKMMIELEKQRMEVAKEVELQRINMLMDMQLELEKSKLEKRRASSGFRNVTYAYKRRTQDSIRVVRAFIALESHGQDSCDLMDMK